MEKPVVAAVGFSYRVQIDQAREIVAQTHIPIDASPKEYHAALDQIGKAIDRQEATYALRRLKRDLAKHDDGFIRMGKDMEEIEAKAHALWEERGRKGPFKLSSAERSQKDAALKNVEHWKKMREQLVEDIAECEAKIKDAT